MWAEIVKTLGGTAILVAAVAWLTRSLVQHLLNKDVEQYKSDLKTELETHKLKMQMAALEHEVRFRRVDEKVADAISDLHGRLHKLFESVKSYVSFIELAGEPSKEEKLKLVSESNREFNDSLFANRLYIPPKLFQRTRDCGTRLADIANDFSRGLQNEEKGIISTEDEGHWTRGFKAIQEEASPLFSDLVSEFQKRVGVEDEQTESRNPEA